MPLIAAMIRQPDQNPFVPTDGIHNLRDYGGYAAADGTRVKTGILFRSGQHMEATDSDLEKLQDLDIRTIIDFRGETERGGFPCRRHDEFDAHVIAYDGETTSSPPHEGGWDKTDMTAQKARDRMIAVYKRMPVNPAMPSSFQCGVCVRGSEYTGMVFDHLLHLGDLVT